MRSALLTIGGALTFPFSKLEPLERMEPSLLTLTLAWAFSTSMPLRVCV